jgi:hypothetical protein
MNGGTQWQNQGKADNEEFFHNYPLFSGELAVMLTDWRPGDKQK